MPTDLLPPPGRWDRSRWITVFSSHSPTIREVTECLGLGLSPTASTTNRGIPKFDAPEFKKLSNWVQQLSKELPQERDALLDFAANPNCLEKELDDLLEVLGPQIWGKDADRSRLITPDPMRKTYYKDLYYEDPADRDIIKTHLQRWVVIKACYWIRNRKLKKHPVGEESENVTEMEVDSPVQKHELVVKRPTAYPSLRPSLSPSQSPLSTPQSVTTPANEGTATPATEGGAQQPRVLQKRKSSAFMSVSDDEGSPAPSSGSRKRSHHNATLPIQRKSPRRSLAAKPSADTLRRSPGPDAYLQNRHGSMTPGPDADRTLPPIQSAAFNGTGRPNHTPPHTFAAINRRASGSVDAMGSAPGALNMSAGHTLPAIHTLSGPVLAPRSTPAPAPGSGEPSSAIPPVNPGSFAVANSTNSPKPPAAQHPHGYASPYNGTGDHHMQDVRTASNGHHEPPAHQAPPQREPSPPRQSAVHPQHRNDISFVSEHSHPAHRVITPKATPPSQHPQAFHSHSIPPVSGVSNFQPKFHANAIQHAPNGLPAPYVVPSNVPTKAPTNGHHPHHHPSPRQVTQSEMVLRQCELLGYLMHFFFPRDQPALDEGILLQNLQYIWEQNEPIFRRQMGPLFDVQNRVLNAWIQERWKIIQLQHAMESKPGVRPSEMVDRLLAMNDLRVMRLKWKAMKTPDERNAVLSPEDLLCRTLATMTRTEGTENLFKEGLEKLNESVFEFLRSEDMKISMSKR